VQGEKENYFYEEVFAEGEKMIIEIIVLTVVLGIGVNLKWILLGYDF
jgi:hypothetical protein